MTNLNIVVISGENLNKEILRISQETGKNGALVTVEQDYYAINASPGNEPNGVGKTIMRELGHYPIDAEFTALPGWRFNIIREADYEKLDKRFIFIKLKSLTPKPKINDVDDEGAVLESVKMENLSMR